MNKFLVKSLVKYCLKKDNPIEYALRCLKGIESEAENWHEVINILKERKIECHLQQNSPKVKQYGLTS